MKQEKEDLLKGLTDTQVEASRAEKGSNKLKDKDYPSFFELILDGLKDPMCIALLVCLTILTAFWVLGFTSIIEPVGILISLILATTIPAKQEVNNQGEEKKLQKLKDEIQVKTMRNGQLTDIMINDLVVGDVVKLQAGDKVPADGFLIDGAIKVSLAAHNGESEEQKRVSVADPSTHTLPTDLKEENLKIETDLYRESVVTSGTGYMLIAEVGDNTRYGKTIANLEIEEQDTPLQAKLAAFGKGISIFGIVGGIAASLAVIYLKVLSVMSIGELFHGIATLNMEVILALVNAVVLAVAIVIVAVPEGLPMMIGSVLAMNTKKLLKDSILVRKLNGIEAAGSINIQFTDKTGTLTKGELEVVEAKSFNEADNDMFKISALLRSITETEVDSNGKYIGGNFTEVALLKYAHKFTSNIPTVAKQRELPFDSANKFSLVVLADGQVIVKGAPDFILDYEANPAQKTYVEELADKAMRTIALVRVTFLSSEAHKEFDALLAEQDGAGLRTYIKENHETVCIFGIRDEYRESAKEAIKLARKAHVQVVMVTGDNIRTATAIAKDLDMLSDTQNPVIIDSTQLAAMTDEEVVAKLADLRVVARAQPQDKQRLVKIAQSQNLVCGMTGDGANDAPALRQADVGFAMGSGTEVAKEAGDITILDDNFVSVVKTINYGRTVFNSIRKFLNYQMIVNISAIALAVVGPFFGVDEPLSVAQLLLINLVMDTLAALALSGEPCLQEYMNRKPIPRTAPILTKGYWIHIGVASALTSIVTLALTYITGQLMQMDSTGIIYGVPASQVKTGIFVTFIMCAVFNCFVVRGREHDNLFGHIKENNLFLKVQGIICLVLLVLVYGVGKFVGLVPVSLVDLITCSVLGLLVATLGHFFTKPFRSLE